MSGGHEEEENDNRDSCSTQAPLPNSKAPAREPGNYGRQQGELGKVHRKRPPAPSRSAVTAVPTALDGVTPTLEVRVVAQPKGHCGPQRQVPMSGVNAGDSRNR